MQTSQVSSPPAADELFPEDEFNDAFSRLGLIKLSRRPRPRPAAAGGGGDDCFVPITGTDIVAPTDEGMGDFTGESIAGADVLALAGSGLIGILVLGTMAGEFSGVLLCTIDSLLVEGLGGSMLSLGT